MQNHQAGIMTTVPWYRQAQCDANVIVICRRAAVTHPRRLFFSFVRDCLLIVKGSCHLGSAAQANESIVEGCVKGYFKKCAQRDEQETE